MEAWRSGALQARCRRTGVQTWRHAVLEIWSRATDPLIEIRSSRVALQAWRYGGMEI